MPAAEFPVPRPLAVLVPKPQSVPEVALETKVGKTKSPIPSPQKMNLHKQKEPKPEIEELEDTTKDIENTEGGTESEEEEPSIPKPEQPKEREIRSSGRKKPDLLYRSPFTPKCQSKTPGKGEGSNNKPRGK